MGVQYDPTDRLLHPAVVVRTAAVRVLTRAIEMVLGWLDLPDADDEWLALIETVARAAAVTDARLERMLDERSPDQRRGAAAILSRRGVSRGTRILVEEFATRALVSEHIGRGPEGIRTLCTAVPCPHPSDAFIAERLAGRRKATAATVYMLAETPALGADRVAVRVLGHWDEPRSVDLLCAVAEDHARSADVREAALGAMRWRPCAGHGASCASHCEQLVVTGLLVSLPALHSWNFGIMGLS
jgi:hypothetical protein